MRVAEDEQEPTEIKPTLLQRSLAGGATAAGGAAAAGSSQLATIAYLAAGAALPYAEVVAHRVVAEFRGDARDRVEDMLAAADWDLGSVGPDRLADLAGKSTRTRLLTTMAADAAARTAWPPKVIALGRVLAAGLIAADEAEISVEDLSLTAMAEMERLHVSLLELLVRWQPTGTEMEAPYVARRLRDHRYWGEPDIIALRPGIQLVLGILMGTLARHGLAVRNMTDFATPTLLATPLGERVLGFYQLAADTAAIESDPA